MSRLRPFPNLWKRQTRKCLELHGVLFAATNFSLGRGSGRRWAPPGELGALKGKFSKTGEVNGSLLLISRQSATRPVPDEADVDGLAMKLLGINGVVLQAMPFLEHGSRTSKASALAGAQITCLASGSFTIQAFEATCKILKVKECQITGKVAYQSKSGDTK